MKLLNQIVAHPATIFIVVFLLTAWAAFSYHLLRKGVVMVRSQIASGKEILNETPDAFSFALTFERVAQALSGIPLLGPQWRAFSATLVLPNSPGRLVRATSRADDWFDVEELVREAGVQTRYHAALPSMLVGAGLLFTFLGLAVALSAAGDVASANSQNRVSSLKELLDAASLKFVTSLFGLLLSLLYTGFRHSLLSGLDRQIAEFLALLNARIPLLTPAYLQSETNTLLERNGLQLEQFSTDLALNIGSAFDKAFDNRLGEHIGPLSNAIEQLVQKLSAGTEAAFEQIVDRFLEALDSRTGGSLDEVANKLATLGDRLDGLQTGLNEAAAQLASSAEAMASRMSEGAEAALSRITDQMSGVTEALREVAEQTRNAGTEAGAELARRIEAAAGGFETAAAAVANTLQQAVTEIVQKMNTETGANSSRMAAQFETMIASLRALADSSRETSTAALEGVTNKLGSAAGALETTSERVAAALEKAGEASGGALGRGAEDAVGRIATATEAMRAELEMMVQELRKQMLHAGAVLNKQAREGGGALQESVTASAASFGAAITDITERLRGAGESAGSALRDGGDAARSHMEAGGAAIGAKADGLAGQIHQIYEAGQQLAAAAAALDEAARGAATPLAASAVDLKAASAAANGAVQPLLSVASEIRKTYEQLGGATLQLKSTLDTASRLMEGLNTSSMRFEGLDRALGGTLEELQKGLKGFTDQVQEFVLGVDSNLAKAANSLGSATKTLEETLAEFLEELPRTPVAVAPRGR